MSRAVRRNWVNVMRVPLPGTSLEGRGSVDEKFDRGVDKEVRGGMEST